MFLRVPPTRLDLTRLDSGYSCGIVCALHRGSKEIWRTSKAKKKKENYNW